MSIQVNNNASIDWSSLLNKLDAASKAAGAQGAGGVTAGQSVTVTANVDGVQRTVTFPVPDDLDLPAAVDQAGIDSLCAKLAGDASLGLSEADVKAVHKALSEALSAAAPVLSASASTGSKSVMFDLYQLMALLVEVGQKQRDAAREMREAESVQIQKSIQNQADQQKAAALTGMIAGAICCAVQVIVSVGMLAKQASAFKQQLNTLGTSGVDSARQNLSMLKAANNPQNAQAQLQKVTAQVGGKPSDVPGRTIAETVGDRGFPKTEQAVAKSSAYDRKIQLEGNELRVTTEKYVAGELRSADAPQGPLKTAIAEQEAFQQKVQQAGVTTEQADRYVELSNKAEAKTITPEEETELANLKEQHPNLEGAGLGSKTSAELKTAADNAFKEYSDGMKATISSDTEAAAEQRALVRSSAQTELQRYEDEFASAQREANAITEKTPAAEAAQIKSDLRMAADKLQFARAYAYNELAKPGITSEPARAADIKLAGDRIDVAEHGRNLDASFLKASRALQVGEAKLGIVNAIGNATQGFISGLTSYIQAGAKEGEAQQEKAREELEQTKDLFNQAQELVDAVVQLMQAVTSAETQSMRDAIQA